MRKIELYTSHLGEEVVQYIERSSTIYILTSFIMRSGVRLLQSALQQAAERSAAIKRSVQEIICTSREAAPYFHQYSTEKNGVHVLIASSPYNL